MVILTRNPSGKHVVHSHTLTRRIPIERLIVIIQRNGSACDSTIQFHSTHERTENSVQRWKKKQQNTMKRQFFLESLCGAVLPAISFYFSALA